MLDICFLKKSVAAHKDYNLTAPREFLTSNGRFDFATLGNLFEAEKNYENEAFIALEMECLISFNLICMHFH